MWNRVIFFLCTLQFAGPVLENFSAHTNQF